MRLFDLVQLAALPGPVEVVGPGRQSLIRYLGSLLDETGQPASGFVSVVGINTGETMMSVADLLRSLPYPDDYRYGMLVFAERPSRLPMTALARDLAEAGYLVTVVTGLAYDNLRWACLIEHPEERTVRPWPGSAGFDLPGHLLAKEPGLWRLVNQWQFETFANRQRPAPRPDRTQSEAETAGRIQREANRARQDAQERQAELRRLIETISAERDRAKDALDSVRRSKAYRLGRTIGDATHSWRKAVRLPADLVRIVAGDTESLAEPRKRESVAKPTFLDRLPRFGEGLRTDPTAHQPVIASVVSGSRRLQMAEQANVVDLTPDTPFAAVAEHVPDLMIIDSSALADRGPWAGVGHGLEVVSGAILLEAIDQAQRLSIPVVFRWDLPRSHVPHADPIARIADFVVCTTRHPGLNQGVSVVPQGVPTRSLSPVPPSLSETAAVIGRVGMPLEGLDCKRIPAARLFRMRDTADALAASAVLIGPDVENRELLTYIASYLGAAVFVDGYLTNLSGVRDMRALDPNAVAEGVSSLVEEANGTQWSRQKRIVVERSVAAELATIGSLVGVDELAVANNYAMLCTIEEQDQVRALIAAVTDLANPPSTLVATGQEGQRALAAVESVLQARSPRLSTDPDTAIEPFTFFPGKLTAGARLATDVIHHLMTACITRNARVAQWANHPAPAYTWSESSPTLVDSRERRWASFETTRAALEPGGTMPVVVGSEGPHT